MVNENFNRIQPDRQPDRQVANDKLSLLIVDDHELVRVGMRRLMEDASNVGSLYEAGSGEQAIEAADQNAFDIVFMDLSLPGMSGMDATIALLQRRPHLRIIVLTAAIEATHIRQLLSLGVKGYLTKDCSIEQMEVAIAEVMAGRAYLSPDATRQLSCHASGRAASCFTGLTRRELEIVMWTLKGMRNKEIGSRLFISEKTVSTHRRRVFEKLGIGSNAELARKAAQQGVMDQLTDVQSIEELGWDGV